MNTPAFLVVDLFCGAGGVTTGFEQAQLNGFKIAKVIACVNHDHKAIKSHWKNHPDVVHFEEDIKTLDLTELKQIVSVQRKLYPTAKLILWASLECTNFSKAKGGQPRDADSRTLADHLDRYVEAINPDFIQIENVVEFMSWGPLDEKGKPVSSKNGQDWLKWRKRMCEFGYYDEWTQMNSADFGAYTSRNRLFGCFAKHGLPIIWPQPTHSKNPSHGMFGELKKWNAVKSMLEFDKEGESVFNRKKDLSENTLKRILAGLKKFVAVGNKQFLTKYYSGRPEGKVLPVTEPSGTITTLGGHALVQVRFLRTYHGNGHNLHSIDNPAPTVVTKDSISLCTIDAFLDKHFGKITQQSVDVPAGTIMTNDKHRLVTAHPFLMPTNFNNQPVSVEKPCPVITANRKYHYIVNPSHGGHSTTTENPCPVIIARQDKAPLYLVQAISGNYSIPIYDNDSETMVEIKKFMTAENLVDIKMRMLNVSELKRIQGFPEDYHLEGNQSDQKKFIGNSVVPHVVKSWCEAMANEILKHHSKIA